MHFEHFNVTTSFRALTKAVFLSAGVLTVFVSATSYADSSPKLGYRIVPQPPPQQSPFNSGSTFANSTYKDVTVPPHMTRPPVYQQNYPYYPAHSYPPQHQSYPNQYPHQPYPPHAQQGYPQQNGLTIIYNQQFPSQTTYSTQSSGYVNGNNGSIQSSTYMLISDWRRYNLPDPSVGMHWIYQDGRYLQIPNDR